MNPYTAQVLSNNIQAALDRRRKKPDRQAQMQIMQMDMERKRLDAALRAREEAKMQEAEKIRIAQEKIDTARKFADAQRAAIEESLANRRTVAGPLVAFAGLGQQKEPQYGAQWSPGQEETARPSGMIGPPMTQPVRLDRPEFGLTPGTAIGDEMGETARRLGPEDAAFYRQELAATPDDKLDSLAAEIRRQVHAVDKTQDSLTKDRIFVNPVTGLPFVTSIDAVKKTQGTPATIPGGPPPGKGMVLKPWDGKTEPPLPGFEDAGGLPDPSLGRLGVEIWRDQRDEARDDRKTVKTKAQAAQEAASFILEGVGDKEWVNRYTTLIGDPEKWGSLGPDVQRQIESKVKAIKNRIGFESRKAKNPMTVAQRQAKEKELVNLQRRLEDLNAWGPAGGKINGEWYSPSLKAKLIKRTKEDIERVKKQLGTGRKTANEQGIGEDKLNALINATKKGLQE